jgi:hypothetical protein
MTVVWTCRPASELSGEELLRALSEHQRVLFEIDLQIDEWEAEATPLSHAEGPAEAMNDPHSVKLIRTRKDATASVEAIELELQRRKNK